MIVVRYEDARAALTSHLVKGTWTNNYLDGHLVKLGVELETAPTPWKKANCKLNIGAIEAFLEWQQNFPAQGRQFVAPKSGNAKLKVADVNISIALDVSIEGVEKNGKKSIGGAVLVFSKSGDVEERCKAIASLVHELVEITAGSDFCDHKLCWAIDVIGKKIYRASAAKKKFKETLESSCEEIATRWPKIQPPNGYNGPPVPES
jgi:hypothetical protein